MSNIDDLGEQVKIQAKLNELLRERIKLEGVLSGAVSNQSKMYSDLNDSLEKTRFPTSRSDEFSDSLNRTSDSSRSATDAIREAARQSENYSDTTMKTSKNGKGFIDWLKEKQMNLAALATSFGNVIGSVYDFAKSLYALVSGAAILDELISRATSLPINTAFAEAREEVRLFAGDLRTGPGKAILDGFKDIAKQSSNMANVGLSLSKVYGRGQEGRAAALKDVLELAEKLGPSLSNFTKILRENATEFLMLAKGMGVSNEQFAETLRIAESIGKDPLKYAREFGEVSAKSLKTFGVSAKIMGRGMADLQASLPHLRREGPKAFAPIVAYAQKLGLELKSVTGMLDTFSGVEKGLEVSSMLAQMGVAFDGLAAVAEKDPAKIMNQVAESFKRAGKQIDLTDRHQRGLLKSTLGVDDATLDRIASQNGLNKSYKDTLKQEEAMEKNRMSQQQVMAELGKGIKRLIQVLDPGKMKGFWDALTKGFSDGFFRSKQMMNLMYQIKGALLGVYHIGIQLGKSFVQLFPGVKEMIAGISKLFDVKAYRGFAIDIKNSFENAMKIFKTNPQGAVKQFIDSVWKGFEKFRKSTGNFLENIMPGLQKFGPAIGNIVAGIIRFFADGLVKGIKSLSEIIKHGFSGSAPGGGLLGDMGKVMKDSLIPIIDAIVETAPLVWDATKEMFTQMWIKAEPTLTKWKNNFFNWLGDTFDSIKSYMRSGNIGSDSAKLWDSFVGLLETTWDHVSTWFMTKAYPKIASYFDEMIDKWMPRIGVKLQELKDYIALWLYKNAGSAGKGFAAQLMGLDAVDTAATMAGSVDPLVNMLEKNKKERNIAYDKFAKEDRYVDMMSNMKKQYEEAQYQISNSVSNVPDMFSAMSKRAKSMFSSIEMPKIGDLSAKGKDIETFATSISSAAGTLSKDNIAIAKLTDVSKSFKGGKLSVSHNLPNTKIEVHVSLDSKKLGSEIVKVDLGTADSPFYFATDGQRPKDLSRVS